MKSLRGVIVLISVLLIGICVGFLLRGQMLKSQNFAQQEARGYLFSYNGEQYLYEIYGEKCPEAEYKKSDYENFSCDQRIVKEKPLTKGKETIVASVKSELPELQDRWNHFLTLFAYLPQSDKIILKSIYSDTDAPISGLYSFDVKTYEIKKIEAEGCFDRSFVLSPDKTQLACIEGKTYGPYQKIRILNLLTEKSKDAVTLSGRETLDGNPTEFGGRIEVRWINNSTIVYGVFNQGGSSPQRPLIGYRTKQIN